jgi:hypothetical protein
MTKSKKAEKSVAVKNVQLKEYGNVVCCVTCGGREDVSRTSDFEEWSKAINEFRDKHRDCTVKPPPKGPVRVEIVTIPTYHPKKK